MVCSSCGYENQLGNRFCGMCGTPLPHPPLTAQGAQSTASLTQPLRENGSSSGPGRPSHDGKQSSSTAEETPRTTSGEGGPAPHPSAVPASQFQLVPEIPLHDYIKNFRYVPPSDPAEVTMRGDSPFPQLETSPVPDAAVLDPVEKAVASAETPPPVRADAVPEGLGLEADVAPDGRKERPKFLDFSEPSQPSKPEASDTPIAEPSSTGLSEVPQAETDAGDALGVEKPAHGKWRMGLAAAVLLIFAGLGGLEWRAQVHQTNGPIEILRMKMRGLARSTPPAENVTPDSKTASISSSPGAAASGPEKTVGSIPSTTPAPVVSPPAEKGPATPQQTSTSNAPSAKPSAATASMAQPIKSQQAGPPPESATDGSKSSPTLNDSSGLAAKKGTAGAEEMAKANHASDSAAEAAWLWKATAKGNPDAPVRLADMYVKGDGVPRSCEQAMVLLKTAATKENALARNRLASMYSSGTCVQRNRVEAYRWLSSALAANPTANGHSRPASPLATDDA